MNQSETISSICSALSHRSRVDVLLALLPNADEGMRTGDLSEVTGLPPSTLSHHLRELEYGGVIERQVLGRTTIVRPNLKALVEVVNILTQICCPVKTNSPHDKT
ncbi:MAG: winged helix-turn-helix domain-containing protein [Rhizobiaceae bacterium]|nr:winged helix-turn-helix domain-containing protein [Rhizobiaceae bacterium]